MEKVEDRPNDDKRAPARFNRLPLEIRIVIWQYATSIIFEVELDTQWRFVVTKTILPSSSLLPLLSTCSESRRECLKAYSKRGDTETVRFDDILYLKKLYVCDHGREFARPSFTGDIRRWDLRDEEYIDFAVGSDKWDGRPEIFNHVHSLAINREVFMQTSNDCESIIRHWFPNLRIIYLLIDDAIEIEKHWDIKDNNYIGYEDYIYGQQARYDFVNKSTGPFKIVSGKNARYAEFIKTDMKKRFKKEEEDYKGYIAPSVSVLGCRVPPNVMVETCGRYPRLQDRVQDLCPKILFFVSRLYINRIDGEYMRIDMIPSDPNNPTSDLEIRSATPEVLLAFVEQFKNIKSRWGPNICREESERILNICAEIQKDIIATRGVSEDTSLIAQIFQLLALFQNSHKRWEKWTMGKPSQEKRLTGRTAPVSPQSTPLFSDKVKSTPKFNLTICTDTPFHSMMRDIIRVTGQLITRGNPADWPSLFCVICLLLLIRNQLLLHQIEYTVRLSGRDDFFEIWEELCRSCYNKIQDPLVLEWNISVYREAGDSVARHMESFNEIWVSNKVSKDFRGTFINRVEELVLRKSRYTNQDKKEDEC